VLAPLKFVPVIVTGVPIAPDAGENPVIVGVGGVAGTVLNSYPILSFG